MKYDEAELRRRMLKLRRNEYDKMILSLMHVIVRLEDVCRLSGSEGAVEEMAEADANGLLDVYKLLRGLTWQGKADRNRRRGRSTRRRWTRSGNDGRHAAGRQREGAC